MTDQTAIDVRELTGEPRLEAMYYLGMYAFHATPPFQNKEDRIESLRKRQGVRYFAVLENEEPVAGAAYTQMTQNVRGKFYPAHGVWDVVTLPQARRNGYSRRSIGALLAAGRADGHVFSLLYPFRDSFYGRLGYINFPCPKIARFAPQNLAPVLKMDLPGEVRNVLIGDGYQDYQAYLARMHPRQHGMGIFDYGDEHQASKNTSWCAQVLLEGEIAGMMVYQLRGESVTHFKLRAHRFYYDNPTARFLLLQWIARHIDQADQAELWLRADEYPETWIEDLNLTTEPIFAVPMGRIVDVAGLAGLPAGPGWFSARIQDPLCPWNEGNWVFESQDGVLQVAPAPGAVDCCLSIRALSALVYGVNDPGEFALRGWGDPKPETQAVQRQMFPPMVPYIHELF